MSGTSLNYLTNRSYNTTTNLSDTKKNQAPARLAICDGLENNPEKDSLKIELFEKKSLNETKPEFSFIDMNDFKIEVQKSNAKANITDYNPEKHVSSKNADFFYVNGIMTDTENAKKTASILSEIMGKPVTSIWSKKEGLVGDLIKAVKIDQANNSRILSSETASEISLNVINSLKNGKNIKLFAHSRGASETANALWDVRSKLATFGHSESEINKMMSHIEVVTMGGLASPSDFPSDVKLTQIRNPDDPIPKLNSDKSTDSRNKFSELESELKIKTRENKGKPLKYPERAHLYIENLYGKGNLKPNDLNLFGFSTMFIAPIPSVTSLYLGNPDIGNNIIGKTSTGLKIYISEALSNFSFSKMITLPIALKEDFNVITQPLKKLGSSHLVNAGSNNYLGEKNVQDLLIKVAND